MLYLSMTVSLEDVLSHGCPIGRQREVNSVARGHQPDGSGDTILGRSTPHIWSAMVSLFWAVW